MENELREKIRKKENIKSNYENQLEEIRLKRFRYKEQQRTLNYLMAELTRSERSLKSFRSEINRELRKLKNQLQVFEEDINVQQLINIQADSTSGYIVEFLKIQQPLNVQQISKRFKLAGRMKQYKTLYKTLDKMVMRSVVKRIDSFNYELGSEIKTTVAPAPVDVEPDAATADRMALMVELANIHVTSNKGRAIEFFKLKKVMNNEQLSNMFKLMGKAKPHTTIATVINELLKDGHIIKIDENTYKFVDNTRQQEYNELIK